ncbi:MAG: hypothetical protein ACFFDE_04155 [Promethearchaeota archaeon]
MKGTRVASGLQLVILAIVFTGLVYGGLLPLIHNTPAKCTKSSYHPFLQHSPISLNSWSFFPLNSGMQGTENSLLALFTWVQQNSWHNWESQTTFAVNPFQGALTRETLNFTKIQPKPIQLSVEDYNPANSPYEDYIWSNEYSYMSFHINGTEAVRVDGFWIYLRGESKGILRYRVYQAQPGIESSTFVNTSVPLTGWTEVPISPTLQPGQEQWFWIETNESALLLDPTKTYANTFYFGIARAYDDDTRINWVYCMDDANPDEADEGDCYGYINSWSYRTRDLFLNISILPENQHFNPTDVNMEVNGETVANLSSPATGSWDSGPIQPPLDISNSTREFSVTVAWSDFYQWAVEFDVLWSASFQDASTVHSNLHLTSGQEGVNWLLTIIIDFPNDVDNQTILLTFPPDWIIHSVLRNTLPNTAWIINDDLLIITDAEDGLWQILCTVPLPITATLSGFMFWFIIIFLILFFSSLLFYRQQVLLPRQRIRRQRLQALADSFYDIEKIKRVLLIHKETGLCLLDPIVDKKMKANLVTALIQAITTFGLSLTDFEQSPTGQDDTPSLRQITYRDFHIMVHDGKYMRNAIIFSQPPSGQLHIQLEQLTSRFEEHYADVFEHWAGRLNIFSEAINLVNEYLFITIRLPHTIHDGIIKTVSLSTAERALYNHGKKLSASQGSFLIRDLLSKYQSDRGAKGIEVFEAIFNLRQKGIMVPVQTDFPYSFSNTPAS